MNRRLATALGAASLLIATLFPVTTSAAGPEIQGRLPTAVQATGSPIATLDRSLLGERGSVDVVVRLKAVPTALVKGKAAQAKQLTRIAKQQRAVWAAVKAADAKATLHGTTRVALNALLVRVDARVIAKLAKDPRVESIGRVRDYQLDLDETVPYIGATQLQGAPSNLSGAGVVVAVLDTGIDYTHAAFGGPGTLLAYKNAYGVKTKDAKNRKINDAYKGAKLFPTEKVIAGWDFVGEAWDGSTTTPPLAPDPDPIDCSPSFIGCDGGHGTHVADIIAGAKGVAPGASVISVKVCSSVSTACSGVAMLRGLDFALDPNGDGLPTDAADIVNMSIGSPYGQSPDDDLSAAIAGATAVGTLVVASAGNSGDKPYVTGTPAAAPSALSVAQTAVPSSTGFAMLLSTGGAFTPREAVFQSWSKPLTAADAVTAVPVQFGDGAGANLLGCDPFPAGSLVGKVVLVDRGVCNFSLKIANIAGGGGKIGVIGLVTPGDPFDGGLGDCPSDLCHAIPGFMVSQSTATAMKNPAALVSFDPANGIPLVGHLVGSSSRGPDNGLNLIKPEIGAPGASVSALVGTGTGTEPFGGTSGAAPMVAGSAALLRQAYPGRGPLEIKAALINTGETEILNRPTVFGGQIAPITRIGGGEVRVNRAWDTDVAAWEDGGTSAALSFGFHDITADGGNSITKHIRVRNYGASAITYAVSSTFRFANDASNGAVSVAVPPSVTVPAGGSTTFDVTITIDGSSLRAWSLDSGLSGASASALQSLEYDGYVWLDAADGANDIHLPWQVLPRQSAAVTPSATSVASGGSIDLTNGGVGAASITSLALVATDPDDVSTPGGDNVADVDLRYVGVRSMTGALSTSGLGCDSQVAITFGVTTWDRQIHANGPALFEFDLDTNQDGTFDYAVYNFDLSNTGSLSDGRNVVFAQNLATGAPPTAFWGTGHSTNSANTQLTVCGEQIGLDAASIGSSVDVLALAADWYNSGRVTDFAEFTMVVGGDRYAASFAGAGPFSPIGTFIDPGAVDTVQLVDGGAAGKNPTETGVLLQLDGSLFGAGGAAAGAETMVLEVTAP
jgi:subtilisin family serine protease